MPREVSAAGKRKIESSLRKEIVLPASASVLRPCLRWNLHYQNVQPPPGFLARVAADSQKYARARSDYIHPLYGPSGEVLTMDWAADHSHHRGIYWAWPKVMLDGQTGDLHALQRVFARPVGKPATSDGEQAASIEAANDWLWEDRTPIVHEKVQIRAEMAGPHGRRIDLTLIPSASTSTARSNGTPSPKNLSTTPSLRHPELSRILAFSREIM